jgi:LPPG:FO 2-phospho-L-lactate transferase
MKMVALAGGVGGAKMVHGMASVLPADQLTVVVNTGDDFVHMGLLISPDLDTVLYTLAGLASQERGWGRADETWSFMETLGALGGPTWFRLGDRDLALHIERTRQLRSGMPLSEFTRRICDRLAVDVRILPMSDDPVRTIVTTDEGELAFQEYFVARRCEPVVHEFHFEGIQAAQPAPGVLDALHEATAVLFCPSNPWVSIAPILAVPGLRDALQQKFTIAVSPIIAGQAVRGPAAKMYAELGISPSPLTVAEQYGSLLSGFVFDTRDERYAEDLITRGLKLYMTDIHMRDLEDRARLARELLTFIQTAQVAEGAQ